MTDEQIKAQMAKLTNPRRNVLRSMFAGRSLTALWVDDVTDHVQAEFGGTVQHSLYVGPRGGIKHHTIHTA